MQPQYISNRLQKYKKNFSQLNFNCILIAFRYQSQCVFLTLIKYICILFIESLSPFSCISFLSFPLELCNILYSIVLLHCCYLDAQLGNLRQTSL